MATNLQVNASTQQAVGAFNALAASIANTTAQFNALNASMNRGNQTATRFSGSITAINSAFQSLTKIAGGALNIITSLYAGLVFAGDAIIKQLDKLQGFQAIMSVTTKSAEEAASAYDFLRKTADRLGVQFDTITGNYAKLVASMPAGTKGLQIAEKAFLGVAMAARTLHSTQQETSLMFYAITQIASKGVVSMEELRRQLGEKLPGVMQIAAKALNTLPETLEAAIRKGIVSSEKFLPIFGDALIRTFADSSKKASESVSASINRLTNVWTDFVKQILDSGAGQSIVGVFDALREKLSDPYLIERFAILVKDLAERVTEFIRKLTADDIRTGFDTMAKGIEIIINVVGKLIDGLTWVINNAGKAGAIIGAVGGAAAGAVVAGPYGAAAGFVAGGIGGYAAGSAVTPSDASRQQRAAADAAAVEAKAMQARERELFKFNALIPMLQNFKGLNSFKGLENLFNAENLNTKTLVDLNRILTGPEFKDDKQRSQGVLDYAKFGTVVGPQNSTLNDVLTIGKGKGDKSLANSEMKALGLNPNIQKELANYLILLRSGKLDMDQYTDAVQTLIAKQPYMIAYQKELTEAQSAQNKATSDHITAILKQVEAMDDLNSRMEEELRLAPLRGENLQIESQVLAEVNRLKSVGRDLTMQEIAALREKFKIINDTRQIAGVEAQILAATLDKYKPQIDTMKALGNLQANEPGFGKQQATDYLVQQNPGMFQGTQEAMDAQRRSVEDYYAFVDGLRRKDYISEQTAIQMKAKAEADYQTSRLSDAGTFFGSLATLSKSGNKKIADIGRAAAVAQATIDGILAVQKALASAPPPVNYALAAAVGVAAAANVASIMKGGFYEGGYTGNMGRTQVAGVVHGQEFVMNASATARNRATLEAMNRGQSISPQVATQPMTPVKVIVNNNAEGTRSSVKERDTPEGREIEVLIEAVASKSIKRGGPIATAMESQYGLNRANGLSR